MSDRVAFLYRWINIHTKMWYIGSRTAKGCHPDDGYICSSKIVLPMISENRNEWVREVLVISNPKYILHLETRLLQSLNAKDDIMSFNKHNGDGIFISVGDDNPMRDPNIAKKLSDSVKGDNHWTKKKPASYINPQIGQKRPTISGDKHPNKRPENAAKISKSHLGKRHLYAEGANNVMNNPEIAAKISGEHHWTKKIPKSICEYCGIQIAKSNYTRWHGTNCKKKEGRV